ncbi:hypothetical protein [Thermococcus sp. MAR1]|uniref:hypothetical protein n=1 Tax=Thermococcus sp. MAR1 TaxID=1638263 RepID=UPI00143C8221|nr:hypothetical protein [Thermococcus sp. MAR1]NJE10073.1 hypothetical protein [Thermococcus sp. MAR1]
MTKWVGKALGFIVLTVTSLTFLELFDLDNGNFAVFIAYVLLIFAWMDYFKLIIYVFLAFGAIAGFFLGNLDGLIYGFPTGLAYLLFAYLLSTNRERLATLVFVLSIPLAIITAKFFPISSTVIWGLIGLMAGAIENAVIEEMAEGDVFIIALYFMALGPFAFIPLALQAVTGITLFEKQYYDGSVYPVGPAMFVVSVPLFALLNHLASTNSLPEWLFYGYYHGVTNPKLAVIGAFLGTFGIPFLLSLEQGTGTTMDFEVTVAGATIGAVAGLVAGLATLGALGVLGFYVDKLGYHNLAGVLALVALLGSFVVGGVVWVGFSQLHYEGRSSINPYLWLWGIEIASILLSLYLLRYAWGLFEEARVLALVTGLIFTVLFYLSIEKSEGDHTLLDRLWQATLYFSAFLAGLWAGFGMLWILQ